MDLEPTIRYADYMVKIINYQSQFSLLGLVWLLSSAKLVSFKLFFRVKKLLLPFTLEFVKL